MRKSILAAALVLVSGQALAQTDPNSPSVMSNFSYDYVEARIGASPGTFGAGMSKSIHPNAHAIGRIDSEFSGDFDAAAGVGFHAPINNWADLTGEILFRIADDGTNGTDSGMELNVGVRQWLGPQLEVGGKAGYVSLDDNEDWVGAAYARFHASELFSLGAEARLNDFYDDQIMFTTRFKF
ncbi:porin family protein [Vibrio intestinalis]|uniref:porin family protein n=1 Tax=Vibrio intestinalis TaxID=2933291 RepID=UPI0021A4E932|nr:porin family protein [Vibrio intestinalis]